MSPFYNLLFLHSENGYFLKEDGFSLQEAETSLIHPTLTTRHQELDDFYDFMIKVVFVSESDIVRLELQSGRFLSAYDNLNVTFDDALEGS